MKILSNSIQGMELLRILGVETKNLLSVQINMEIDQLVVVRCKYAVDFPYHLETVEKMFNLVPVEAKDEL